MQYNVSFPGLGLEFTLNRVAFSLGGFNIYWYGVLIALGMVLAMAFAFHFAVDFGINADRLIDVVFIGTIM
ncbi:MAG: prolipoprotein diacylglyceryl transferase, partial [Gemmiger sp.]|nr:prolipoprotein diacylglyceryl transferase [Gemmiger sp.]